MEIILIGGAVVLVVSIGLGISKFFKRRCTKCKTKLTYEDIIDCSVGGTKMFGAGNSAGSAAFTDVKVLCKCPNCGKEKKIVIHMKSYDRNAFGMRKTEDLEQKLMNYMR